MKATAHEHEHGWGICHVMLMILVQMNYRHIVCFSVYAAAARRTFICVALRSRHPRNVNDPDFASAPPPPHHHNGPQTSKPKERGKDVLVCMFACYQSLFSSSGATTVITDGVAPTVTSSQLAFLCLWPRRHTSTSYGGPYRGPHCFHQHTLSCPSSLSELTDSFQKGLKACSFIIWILVNWINCSIGTVLLKMTKTQGQRGKGGGLLL